MNLRKLKYISPIIKSNVESINDIKIKILKYNNNPIIEFNYKIYITNTLYTFNIKDYEYCNIIIHKINNNLFRVIKSRYININPNKIYTLHDISRFIHKFQDS